MMIYHIVILVLLLILFTSLLTLTLLSRRNIPQTPADPSRTFLPYFTSTLSFSLSATFLSIIANAISIAAWYVYSRRLYDAIERITTIANLFHIFSLCALIQTISRLAIGLRVAATSRKYISKKFSKAINILSIITAATWTLWFIWRQVALSLYSRNIAYSNGYSIASLVFAITALVGCAAMMIAGITALVYAVKAMNVVKGKEEYSRIAKRVIAVASVEIVILAWTITRSLIFGAGGLFAGWWNLINMFVVHFAMVGVFTVIYLVARRRERGLWSDGVVGSLESGRDSGEVIT